VKVGRIEVVPVLDGTSLEPLDELVSHAAHARWDSSEQPLDGDGRMAIDIGAFLVRTGVRTILIDAGIGTITDARRQGGGLPASLRRYDVDFADVTDVIFTHLHFDHVGWATQKGKVMFPHATYRVHQADWDHFVLSPEAQPGAIRKLTPLEGQLETFDSDLELAPGLHARPAPGHSPGHTTFVVADQGARALILGDVVHVIPELTDPQWHFVHDVDPKTALEVRDRIVDELAQTGDPFTASHFPGLRFGRLETAGGRRHFAFI
jgi:glyoxylase-like metal-dependent hydrolase (beta-lactamase superfamily II)